MSPRIIRKLSNRLLAEQYNIPKALKLSLLEGDQKKIEEWLQWRPMKVWLCIRNDTEKIIRQSFRIKKSRAIG